METSNWVEIMHLIEKLSNSDRERLLIYLRYPQDSEYNLSPHCASPKEEIVSVS